MTRRFAKVFLLIGFLSFQFLWSQANIPPDLVATGDQFYCPLSQINIVTDFNIIDPDDTEIDVMHIQISTGYQTGQDQLILTGSHPTIVTSWNTTEGKLSLNGVGGSQILYSDLVAAVKDVVFESTSASISGEKYFSFTIGDANYLPSTDHFYEYVSDSGISWSDAKTAAESRTYFGLQGYLATISSLEEAQLSGEQASGVGWLGGSDSETPDVWKWVTGPEAGTVFWNGQVTGSTPNYANWNTNEPNDFGGGTNSEQYVHVTSPNVGTPGSWNDLPNAGGTGDYFPQGYIVEYGGMPGDPVIDISASTKIKVPSIIYTTEMSVCDSGNLDLEAFATDGNVLWFTTPTGGTPIATGNFFTTPNISTTTTYYVLASINSCTDGERTPVTATVYQTPTILTTTDDLLCVTSSAQLEATASSGVVNWYTNPVGGPLIFTGNTFITPNLSVTTTYYVSATANGCETALRTPVTATIQYVPTPTASTLQTFCDVENANIADLVITGTDISWYDVPVAGTQLNFTDALTSGTYYATQNISGCESSVRLVVNVIIYETVEALPIADIPIIEICDTDDDGDYANGFATFNLTLNETILLNGKSADDFQFSYFTDAAYSNQILNPSTFINTIQNTQTIYVRIENVLENSCYTDISIDIVVNALPEILNTFVFKNCDEDGVPDGFTDYNLEEVIEEISNDATGLTITYYLSLADAETETSPINPVPFNNSTASTVYIRFENNNGCYDISEINLQVSTTSFPLDYMQELETCDDDDTIDGLHTFDLSQASEEFIAQFPLGQNLTVHYYRNLADAQLEDNEILPQDNYINETAFSQLIYIRVESDDNGECFGIGPHLTLTVHPRPEFEVDQSEIFCLNDEPITLITFNPSGVYSYEWTDSSGSVVSNLPTATVLVGGEYTVIATSSFGCQSFPVLFTVVESAAADVDIDDITIVELSDNNSISINNSNNNLGIGDYEFALDDISGPYQDAPYFNNVGAGVHTIYIQDKNGCGISQLEIFVMGFPKYFTPNNDGYNDTWNVKGLSNEFTQQSSVHIYDRFGKLIKQLNPRGQGWDGTFNGEILRTSDYWFVVTLEKFDGKRFTHRGHFSLVR